MRYALEELKAIKMKSFFNKGKLERKQVTLQYIFSTFYLVHVYQGLQL